MMMTPTNAPYFYDHRNLHNAMLSPSSIHAYNTGLERFFRKYLYERAMSVYEWKLPDSYNRYYFKWVLWSFGFIFLFNDKQFGQVCQQCTLKGYDLYYYPKQVIITNPAFTEDKNGLILDIDKDGILLNLKGDFTGIEDIVSFYSSMLAVVYESFGINAIQAKTTNIYGTSDKKTGEELKKIQDLIMSGKPAVVTSDALFNDDGKLTMQQFTESKDFLGMSLLDCVTEILHNFDAEIGIPTANTQKKERLISGEVNSQKYESMSRSEMWLEDLKLECEKARKLLGIEIDVNFRYNVFDEMADSNINAKAGDDYAEL